ncbi:MAG: PH domain-containing protein [Sphingomonadaceae bacterium]
MSPATSRLHPATLLSGLLRSLPQTALAMPAAVGFASEARFGLILLLALAGLGLSALISFLVWTRFRYGVGDNELVIESGVLERKRRVIPFTRIQDVDIERGLVARLFGTAKVKIETGGSASDEGVLDMVELAEARRLREFIRRRRDGSGAAQAFGEEAAEPLLFAMDLKRVLTAGLFNFSLVYFAILLAALQYAEPFFPVDIWDPERWLKPASALYGGLSWIASLAVLIVIVLLGVIAGVVRTLLRDYRFRLTRSERGLRRRRGLFTLSEVMIPIRRIQLPIVRTGLIARRFGWHRLEFQTLSADVHRSGHQVAAPFARIEEILPVIREVEPRVLPLPERYTRVSRRHIARQTLRYGAILMLPALSLTLIGEPGWLLLLAIPLAAILAAWQWRHHSYALGGHALYVRQGFLRRRLYILPYSKLQTLGVTRGPVQRAFGLATLHADSAGASYFRYCHIANLRHGDAEGLRKILLERFFAARAGPADARAAAPVD